MLAQGMLQSKQVRGYAEGPDYKGSVFPIMILVFLPSSFSLHVDKADMGRPEVAEFTGKDLSCE